MRGSKDSSEAIVPPAACPPQRALRGAGTFPFLQRLVEVRPHSDSQVAVKLPEAGETRKDGWLGDGPSLLQLLRPSDQIRHQKGHRRLGRLLDVVVVHQ